jgi:lysophospholipase L1-like esterase
VVKKLIFRVLLALLSVVMVLVTVEAGLRIAAARRPAHPTPWGPHYDRSHATYVAEDARLHPWTDQATGGVFRVAVIGDSFTVGGGVQAYDSYARRLEQMLNLNRGVRPAAVDVYAEGGTCTFQQIRFLGQALATQPDLVVLGICLNDAEDWQRPEEFKAWRNEILPRKPVGWVDWITLRSQLAQWLYRKKEGARGHRAHLDYYRRLYHREYSGWIRFSRALGDFQAACDQADVPLFVALFPMMSWDFSESSYPFLWVHGQINQELDARGIAHLDLWDAFRGKTSVRIEVIPKLDGHPNEIGHRIAAEAIFEHLVMNGIIDKSYAPRHDKSQVGYWEWMREKMDALPGPGEKAD